MITVEEHTIFGGLGGLVAASLSEAWPRKVVRFRIDERRGESAPNDYLLDLFQMSPPRLSEPVKNLVG
ncbi:MAG TPA: transketolase C-terminal domain-containing protein [Terrimicrobiaceae bacterium]